MHRELPPDLTHTGPVRPTATCPMAKFIHTTNDKPCFTKAPVFPGYVSLSALEITDCSHMPVLTYRELTPALTIVKIAPAILCRTFLQQDSCSPQLWQKNSTWDGSCLPLLPCPPSYCIQLLAGLGDIYGSCDNPKASSSCHVPSTAALSYELSLFELLSRWCRVSGIRSTEWEL